MIGFPPPSGAFRPDRSSMSLLVELTTNTLDEGYAEAARRRASISRDPGRGPRRGIALLVLAAAGLLLAVAAVQARHRAPATARARASLERDIARQVAATDALGREVRRQRRAIAAQRERALAATRAGADLAGRVATLELAAAQTPVRGPGVSVTLEDAQAPRRPPVTGPNRPGGAAADGGRILDRDVQDVVNALWAVGAEAVAVGEARLTAQSAIRSAGQAILVDFRPLVPPYVITAIGPESLAAAFADSDPAARLRAYTSLYGIGFSVRSVTEALVPGAAGPTLRHARPLPTGS